MTAAVHTPSLLAAVCLAALLHAPLRADTLHVALTGDDANPGTHALPWRTVQHACSTAQPGSTVLIAGGIYNEKVRVTVSGTQGAGRITIMPAGPDSVVLDGTGIPGRHMLLLQDPAHIRVQGLVLRNNTGVTDGGGVRIEGSGEDIALEGLLIEHMRGANAMGITCYGTHATLPLRDIRISGNTVRFCEPAPSEAITLNGNVEQFLVEGNTVADVDNIGIDCIGGEGTCPTPALDRARRGTVRGNRVVRARSSYGGGYAAGIYVDCGSSILVEHNIVEQCDMGIEIGCENRGAAAESVVVRNNLLYGNDKAGLAVGGYDYPRTGLVRASAFLHNTLFRNDVLGTGDGEVRMEYALSCIFRNNIIAAGADVLLTATVGSEEGNSLEYNLWAAPGGAALAGFTWNGVTRTGWAAFRAGTMQESSGRFGDPAFVQGTLPAPDLHILPGSPAEDAGDPLFADDPGVTDMDGEPRVIGARTDAGADEAGLAPAAPLLLEPASGDSGLAPQQLLRWTASARASWYALEVGADSSFGSVFWQDSTGADTSWLTPLLPSDTLIHWRVRGGNALGAGSWSSASRFRVGAYETSTLPVTAGWNLLALPLAPVPPAPSPVIPGALSPPIGFGPTGYAPVPTPGPGAGFWMKFGAPGLILFPGRPSGPDSIPLRPGWNIIGVGADTIGVVDLVEVPSGILLSGFTGYLGMYTPASVLVPGSGYWIKSAGYGWLVPSHRD